MTLELIHTAIRPQFAWSESRFNKLKTFDEQSRHAGFGLLVFIGIANSYGIPKEEIIEYLAIKKAEYETKSKKFRNLFEDIVSRKESGTLCLQFDYIDRVYLKTKLTLNALNSQVRGQTLHSSLYI